MQHIRNFSIIAHIDHGKSTLADRFIQRCGGLAEREMEAQVLDSMDLERERGITIKAQTAALRYEARDGSIYHLNLIDTPGHVDFAYEVSRSLAACEGALLVVDASQGVEAQTVANCYTATEQGVTVVPVLNKIDLPSAEPERVIEEIEDIIGLPAHDAILASAKTGEGVDDILEAVIARIPPPTGDPAAPLQALIIDSWFDNYVGVVMLVRVMEGMLKPRDKIRLMVTGATYNCEQVGVFLIDQGKADVDGKMGPFLVTLGHDFVLRDASAATRAPGHDIVPLIDPSLFMAGLQEMPDRVVVFVRHGEVGIIPIHPVAEAN